MRKLLPLYLSILLTGFLIAQNVNAENVHFNDFIYTFYYPEKNNPLKFAAEQDSEIEKKENLLLLKFIQNKKQDVAVISYLENIIQNNQTYFIYNICKYEKHPKKGTLVLKFAKKYVFNTKEEITKIAQDIKSVNDDYMEQMIILQIPQIVEKEIP